MLPCCRFGGSGASYIEPGSPWENPWLESYGSHMMRSPAASCEADDLASDGGVGFLESHACLGHQGP